MMRKRCYISEWVVCMLLMISCFSACCSIDDDLSDCPPDTPDEKNFELTYELRLVTNITTELTTQLNTTTDAQVADALRNHLQNIFTDYARDVDLSFYNTETPQERLVHEQKVMDASERSYTIHLPIREYQHLAVANINGNSVVGLNGSDRCPTAQLLTTATGETIDSHTTGLFTARQPMTVLEGVNQTFHVRLYMTNCASALVIDPRGHTVKDVKVYTTGFATAFNINDSTYTFAETAPLVRASSVDTNGGDLCFCSVNFPSKEEAQMKTVIETDEPFDTDESSTTFWQFKVYVTLEDGTVTETVLSIRQPLRAGQLKILKGWIGDDGDVCTHDHTVGVSVTLNWNDGGHHDIDL